MIERLKALVVEMDEKAKECDEIAALSNDDKRLFKSGQAFGLVTAGTLLHRVICELEAKA